MLSLYADSQIYLATHPADFRKGIDGFAALCRSELKQDPRSKAIFVFSNRRRTMIRALCYDGTGYWLMTKRLSKGRFQWPQSAPVPFSPQALRQLLQVGQWKNGEDA